LATHIEDVLKLVLEEELTENGKKCFLFFTKPNPIFTESLKVNDILFTVGTQIISNPNTSPSVLSRLSTIFLCMYEACPDQCEEGSGFLFPLLSFIDNTGVFDLFKSICCKDSDLTALQKSLVESKLSTYIVNLLDSTHNSIIFGNLLLLISYGANNKIMWQSFCSEEVCLKLVDLILKDDSAINEKWLAVDSVTCNATFTRMIPIIEKGINLISTSYLNPKPALTFAVDFIQKMLRRSEKSFTPEAIDKIISSLISIMATLPDSSNLIGAVFRLFGVLCKSIQYREHAIEMILPILTSEAPSRVRSAATAHCSMFLLKLQESAKADKSLQSILLNYEEYKELYERFIPWYSKVISQDYGGSIVVLDNPFFMAGF
jgi:hypothetical protein